jgi:hypothetical protein
VGLLRNDEASRLEIREHGLARRVAIEAEIFFRRVVVDGRVEIEDRQRGKPMTLADRPVVEVVGRRDLDDARAELALDVFVGDDRGRPRA